MQTWQVNAIQEVTYRVRQTERVLDPDNPALSEAANLTRGVRRLVVVDSNVFDIYGSSIRHYFQAYGVEMNLLILQADESNKNVESLYAVLDAASQAGLNRRSDPIVAIGGGVLTDVVGLAASLYRRGIPFVRVPTTLIGLVDAAVGIKTAVNFRLSKNRIGTYFPASASLLDQSFLATLPRRHVSSGLAEIIKIAIVRDAELFELLATNAEHLLAEITHSSVGRAIIERAVGGMLEELEPNLWERDLKRLVDFGHTFSPGIELDVENPLLHGEAVAIDMAICCYLAHERGLLSNDDVERVIGLLKLVDLPITTPGLTPENLIASLADATCHRDGQQHLPLPAGIGTALFVEDVTASEVQRAHDLVSREGFAAEMV